MKQIIDSLINNILDLGTKFKNNKLWIDCIVAAILIQMVFGPIKIGGTNPLWAFIENNGWTIMQWVGIGAVTIGGGVFSRRLPKVLEQRRLGNQNQNQNQIP